MTIRILGLAILAAMSLSSAAEARDQIRIAGSSTVFPFTTVVAEQFGRMGKFKTPIVESTGTGGGFKLFCAGVGPQHTDISMASRAIKSSEIDACRASGVRAVTEVKIGYDGIVLANSKKSATANVTRRQVFLALAKNVPQGGKLVPNPYMRWSDIDPKLPAVKIEVMGPPPTSGTRDAFVELVMDAGCQGIAEIDALKSDAKAHASACQALREDGAYIDAGENDNLIVQKLAANPGAVGIFGFSFLDQNADKIQGWKVDGVEPSFEDIASGKYAVSRPLFIYVKNAHMDVVPGLKEFLAEFTSSKAFGADGYLAAKGLIPLPGPEQRAVREQALALKPLAM
jgi:phosphate transport system substrate-binding protein